MPSGELKPSGLNVRFLSGESMKVPSYAGDLIVSWRYRPGLDSWEVTVHKDEAVDPAVGQLTLTQMVSAEEWQKLPELPIKRAVEEFTRMYQQSGAVVPIERDDIYWWQRMVALLAQKLCEERGADRIMVGKRDAEGSQGLYAILQETPEGVEITPQREKPVTQPVQEGEQKLLIPDLWGDEENVKTLSEEIDGVREGLDELMRQQREMDEKLNERKMREQANTWKQDIWKRTGDVKGKPW